MMRNTNLDTSDDDGRRRLLLLSPFAPRLDATMGGPRMIAQLIVALSAANRIGLLYLRAADEPPIDERVTAACEFAIETRRTGVEQLRSARMRPAAAASILRGVPSWVQEWSSPEFAMTLRSVAAGWRPDIVQVEFHLMGQYLLEVSKPGVPTVLNQHEPGTAAVMDRRRAGQMPGRILPLLDVRAWRAYERKLLRYADAVVTFTERDRQEMRALGAEGQIKVISPGAELPALSANPIGIDPPTVLFFGNYLHAPNVDAALRLARDIFPRLAAEVPTLRLSLPGDRAPAALAALASKHVEVPGRVPDLMSYLDRAAVVVVPLRLGGGMRVKVLEALSAGKAIVASAIATQGLDLVDGEHLLHAETDDEFVTRTLRLLADPAERARLAQQARAWAMEHLSWERAAEQYGALYDALLAAPPPRRPGTTQMPVLETVTRSAVASAAGTAEADVARYRADPRALSALPLGRFSDAGVRGLLVRRTLLKLPLPVFRPLAALLARVSPRFAADVVYWRRVKALLPRAEWQSLTHAPVILMYHAVTTPGELPSRYVIASVRFKRHMVWLRSRGYRLLTVGELAQARNALCLPPPRAVVVTFDDGYRDNCEALERVRVPATIFVVTGYMGSENRWDDDGLLRGRPLMTWDEARGLQAKGVEVASHTQTHPRLPEVSPGRMQDELRGSLADLQRELGPGLRTFAYPHGRFDDAAQAAVEEAGFIAVCCSRGGLNDPFIPRTALRRVEIKGTDSFADFVLMVWLGRRITPRQLLKELIFG